MNVLRAPNMLRRRVLIQFQSETKPYDAEIEYLESTGTQYIDAMLLLCADGMNFEIEVNYR